MNADTPLPLYTDQVRPEWIDENGHMNVAHYMATFDKATDAFLEYLDLGAHHTRMTGESAFTVEAHICYLHELLEGDRLSISAQLLGYDTKRIHYVLFMHHETAGYLAATGEFMMLSINLNERRTTTYRDATRLKLAEFMDSHVRLPVPEQIGRIIRVEV